MSKSDQESTEVMEEEEDYYYPPSKNSFPLFGNLFFFLFHRLLF